MRRSLLSNIITYVLLNKSALKYSGLNIKQNNFCSKNKALHTLCGSGGGVGFNEMIDTCKSNKNFQKIIFKQLQAYSF
jgi:hypothetical protein